MWQSEYRLHLYPTEISYSFDLKRMEDFLKDEEFINKKLERNRFSTGNTFVSRLTFMGCSPDIELEPQTDKPFCYIELENHKNAQFISGKNLKRARCPFCKNDILQPTLCSHCKKPLNPQNINWRKTAFFASSWITIGNIYELEAIPNDLFLDLLEKETNTKWKAAYIRHYNV